MMNAGCWLLVLVWVLAFGSSSRGLDEPESDGEPT
jgi:hypothetical protein